MKIASLVLALMFNFVALAQNPASLGSTVGAVPAKVAPAPAKKPHVNHHKKKHAAKPVQK